MNASHHTHTQARSSAWTGRAPRSMNDAFGTHVTLPGERQAAYHRSDRIVMWASAVAFAALVVMAVLKWI